MLYEKSVEASAAESHSQEATSRETRLTPPAATMKCDTSFDFMTSAASHVLLVTICLMFIEDDLVRYQPRADVPPRRVARDTQLHA